MKTSFYLWLSGLSLSAALHLSRALDFEAPDFDITQNVISVFIALACIDFVYFLKKYLNAK